MDKKKLFKLLYDAAKSAGDKEGANLSKSQIQSLYKELDKEIDPSNVNQWMARRKELLSRIPEIAGNASFIDITENPKVLNKDYGFEESPDFYKMDGSKSWMNKSPTQLKLNANKYGLDFGDYLSKVAELATKKEQEKQWKDNASVVQVKDVPYIGDVNIPGLTSTMLPTSFNKASIGKEVNTSDIAYDVAVNELEAGLAATPFKSKARYAINPVVAALTGNAARQGKQIYDETQDKFSPLALGGAGAMGAFGTPIFFKSAGDILKRVPGTQGMKPWMRFTKNIEDIGEVSPQQVLNDKVNELNKATQRYRAVTKLEQQKADDAISQLAKETGIIDDYVPFNPTPLESKLYGKGSKLWRNVKNGEILTEEEYNNAINFLKEANRGQDFIPGKQSQSNLYRRASEIKNMPMGEILVNAWSEPKLSRVLREGGRIAGGEVGGRAGISISDNDKKLIANKIINSADWGRYITGLPHNLTDEEIYIATMYGDK